VTERGLVTSVGSRSVQVHVDGRGSVRCTLRGGLWSEGRAGRARRPVAVGDHVEVTLEGAGGVVEEVAERTNQLTRPQPSARVSRGRSAAGRAPPLQVLAANVDRLLVVAAVRAPPFRSGLVDRFLVAADMAGIDAVVCLNKVDLDGDRAVLAPYAAAGVPTLATSAVTGAGIEELAALLSSGVNLLAGHSGVGKSSLLNAVRPELGLAVGEVTGYHGRGRHTTTKMSLLPLGPGAWVIDSPGIREFGLDDVPPGELARLFPGFGTLPDRCRFSNCLHRDEPDCAVRAAVESGEVAAERYESYLRVVDDLDR